MQRALIVLILLIAGIGVYLFTQKSDSLTDTQPQQSLEPSNQEIEPTVVEAAKEHIEKLTTESQEQVLDITKADNFVTGEQLLKMPTMESEQIAIEQVDSSSAPETAETAETAEASVQTTQTHSLNQQVEQMVETVVEKRAETGPAKTSTMQTNQAKPAAQSSDESTQLVVTQAIDSGSKVIQGAAAAIQSQSVVVTQGAAPAVSFEPAQVDATNLEVTKVGETQTGQSLRPGQRIRLQELLSDPDLAAGTVFYIHAVSPTDAQGLWGILQRGLIKTFAQGIELKESGRVLTAEIPMLADETLENRRSSFLGEFLYQKVQDTYVYNYQQGMLGQDPDLIKPGQQLIIVSYSENELISIFNHFTQPGA
jgi:hypothetical protein